MIDVSIVILTYNSSDFISNCLASVKRWTKGIKYEVIIVDNASSDKTQDVIGKNISKQGSWQLIKNSDNTGFAGGNNVGIKKAKGRYILLLNPDTKLLENSVKTMTDWMDDNEKVGIASCKLLNEDKTIQPTGGFFPTLSRIFLWSTLLDDLPLVQNIFGSYHPHTYHDFYENERELDWVTGAFFLIRREVIEQVGLLDEDFFLYVEELELCLRAKEKGWKVGYVPKTRVLHYVGKSGTREGTVIRELSGLKLLYKKHYSPTQQFILRIFLFLGSFLRAIIFGIIDTSRGKIYAKAIRTI